MSKVWLITGSGSGLGRIIAETALAAGNKVVATARNIRQLDELSFPQFSGHQVKVFASFSAAHKSLD